MVTYPNDWKEEKIGAIFDVLAGGDVKKDFFSRSHTSVYQYEVYSNGIENRGLYGYTSKAIYPPNSLTVTARGTIGTAYYRKDFYDAIIRLLVLIPKSDEIKPKFYEYFINSQVQFDKENTGVPQLTVPKIKEKVVPIFLGVEQAKIVETLECFDTYIDNITELIEKKRNIRDGALEDLVSGRTRLDGFNNEWVSVPFNQVVVPKARIGWQGLKKYEYLRSGYSYLIGGTDFYRGTVRLDNISFVSKDRYDMDSNIQVTTNDVLVTKDGTIGKVALVPKLDKPATLNSGVFVFRTNSRLLPTFLYRVLSSSIFRKFIDVLSAGSTIKHLYQKDLKNFEFMIPLDTDEQEAIAFALTSMDEEIEALENERDKIIQIREGAMDDLLTGRVRLKV